ncbi:MAG: glycosyltransferase family 4 protein [Desulfobacterales bacterium]
MDKTKKNRHSRPAKVLHLISSRGLYGAERIVINLSGAINQSRYLSHLGLLQSEKNPNRELVEAVREKRVQTHVIPCRRWLDLNAMRQIRKLIAREDIDIVHCHEMKGRLYGLVCTIGTKAKTVATNHNWIRSDFLVTCFESLDAFYIRFFPRIVAVSPEVKTLMQRYLIPKHRISVIINGIDMQGFRKNKAAGQRIRKEIGIPPEAILIGAIGRLSPEKGHRHFMEAAAQIAPAFPNARFLLVGDGPLREMLKTHALSLGLGERMIFAGFRKDIADCYCALDMFVLPSLLEGTPMSLLEAMSAQVPVIAARAGGVGRILTQGENGVLVSPGDSAELAAAISGLLQNPAQARGLSANAFRTVLERYSAEKMARAYENIYAELLSGKADRK